jgi:hypothetical protein
MKTLILSLALLLSSCTPVSIVSTPKPNIYITRTGSCRTSEGDVIWILEYTVNGEAQNPGFDSREAMIKFRKYLDTIGKVYKE